MKRYVIIFLTFAVLSLMACQQAFQNHQNSVDIEQFRSLQKIKDYLNKNIASTGFGGKPYCAYEVLDAEHKDENFNVYSLVVCQEYYSDQQELKQGTGSALPVALVIQKEGINFHIVSHRIPRDGALYAEDMPLIFSQKFRAKIQSETIDEQNERVKSLQNEIEKEAGID